MQPQELTDLRNQAGSLDRATLQAKFIEALDMIADLQNACAMAVPYLEHPDVAAMPFAVRSAGVARTLRHLRGEPGMGDEPAAEGEGQREGS